MSFLTTAAAATTTITTIIIILGLPLLSFPWLGSNYSYSPIH